MSKHMLTTFDNPYSPFNDFIRWNNFDIVHGYNTCARLDNVANSMVDLKYNAPEFMQDDVREQAMRDIVDVDPLNLFRIVTEEDYDENNIQIMDSDTEELKRQIEARETPSGT